MTSQELYDNFLLQFDVNGSFAAAGFTEDEIYMFLTKAQLNVIDMIQQAGRNNELSELIISNRFTTVAMTPVFSDAKNVRITNDEVKYYKVLTASASVYRAQNNNILESLSTYSIIPLKEIDISVVDKLLVSDFNKPIYEWINYFPYNNKICIVHDSYVDKVFFINITYISLPEDITDTVTASLNDKFHKEIINEAVKLALISIADQRITQQK